MSNVLSAKLKNRIAEKVQECMIRAERYFQIKLNMPTYNFRQRGRSAGTAYLQRNEMRFNLFMLTQDTERFIEEVVPHEVAHIVVHQVFGSKVRPHGKEWVAVMEHIFNVEASRTHDFEVPKAKNLFEYRCQCRTHEFTAHRHGRVKRGSQYLCRQCGSQLTFVKQIASH